MTKPVGAGLDRGIGEITQMKEIRVHKNETFSHDFQPASCGMIAIFMAIQNIEF